MKKMFVFVFAGLLFNAAAMAGPDKKAADKTLAVDTKSSTITWGAKKVTGTHAGSVPVESGSLIVEGDKLKGGTFVADVKSLVVTDVTDKEMNGKLTGHLKSDDFFSVEKHPQAKLVISSVTPKGGDAYDVVGKLTIKGITQEVKFPATVKADAKKVTAVAKVTVDRTKYDIKFRSANFFENLGDKAIDNDFTLDVNLVANK
ncbi:YceI family protein [Dyadobacter fanqingshengii]|uniref:YceI family protein n=1 Tax=Dyadobacter fanqingshengii TaxID=2906443 RepID=A0A9X1TAT6_9BACT|nr:YceI family protein [Dyadobacter fanqingshengii]MCF0042935.1 YceI family protein [Dyadobacter fanqingshengii]MCF2507050.1 YceI family protein [Dyadobacter fanqingshengii]USJ35490.1 YceI family protein [Dyadobacter fanqingshengii]